MDRYYRPSVAKSDESERACTRVRLRRIILISLITATLVGCILPGRTPPGRDTCNQGDNMTNPRLVNGVEETETGHRIRIAWDPGTEQGASLPTAYFQEVAIEDDLGVVHTVTLTGEREIVVTFEDLTSHLQGENSLQLTLLFPDRRDHISCEHAGMSDEYYLIITLVFTDEGYLDSATFEQGVWLGPI